MPARIVLVHDDAEFANALAASLGPDLEWFKDPIRGLALLESARTIEFLITRLVFANRQPLGLSLARVTRSARPGVRIIFTGHLRHRNVARGLGEFLEEPVTATQIGMIVEWLRSESDLEP
jgi:hypothetical protein